MEMPRLPTGCRGRREQAQQARDILSSLENNLPSAAALNGDRIDGVKVFWIAEGACSLRTQGASDNGT